MPIQPVTWCRLEPSLLTGPGERADADREQEGEPEDDRRVAEREPEADAQRPLALGHQLARRVVDRRDVVGVEGVAHAERVGGDADPDRERARAAERVVVRRDDERAGSRSRSGAGDDHGRHHQRACAAGRGRATPRTPTGAWTASFIATTDAPTSTSSSRAVSERLLLQTIRNKCAPGGTAIHTMPPTDIPTSLRDARPPAHPAARAIWEALLAEPGRAPERRGRRGARPGQAAGRQHLHRLPHARSPRRRRASCCGPISAATARTTSPPANIRTTTSSVSAAVAVTHIHDETLGDLRARIERTSGYQLGRREISFFGICPNCPGGPEQLGEERYEVPPGDELVHQLVRRRELEAACGIEHLRQQCDVADCVEEDAGTAEHPVHGQVDVAPARAAARTTSPPSARDRPTERA